MLSGSSVFLLHEGMCFQLLDLYLSLWTQTVLLQGCCGAGSTFGLEFKLSPLSVEPVFPAKLGLTEAF